jgi:hypothetical protein
MLRAEGNLYAFYRFASPYVQLEADDSPLSITEL